MKYKKFITITLVTILLCTSTIAIATPIHSLYPFEGVKDTGTITSAETDSKYDAGFFILGDKGTYFMGRLYKKYLPLNLPDEFKEEGLRVKFTGKVYFVPSLSSIRYILKDILPIKLITIEKLEEEPPKLKFEIFLEETKYKLGEPIPVIATLKNDDDKPVAVCEMGLDIGTLDFIIETPDGQTIHYIGPFVKRFPKVIIIPPQDSYSVIIKDITEVGLFGNEKNVDEEPYKFVEGDYTITGIYKSSGNKVSYVSINIFEGKLESNTCKFSIVG